ncbi:hypothetical protein [Streptomyces chartreusis]|uniref:hypothetical protein n=1 Tax=Streptomyces chartreusis TaxID=1969 RepID=UPI002095B15F|nr:hypothetical protein [Streptomyces chartreusis]
MFSPVLLKRLVEAGGLTNVGAEMDPSHLMWQGMDVIACIKWLRRPVAWEAQGAHPERWEWGVGTADHEHGGAAPLVLAVRCAAPPRAPAACPALPLCEP